MLQQAAVRETPQGFHAARKTVARDALEIAVKRVTGRNFEMRKGAADFLHPHVAPFRDGKRAGQNVGRVLKEASHFLVALHEELIALELHAIGFLDGLAGLDANHHILGMGIVLAQIVAVVRSHQGEAQVFLQAKQRGLYLVFLSQALVLNFQEEVFFAENFAVRGGRRTRRLVFLFHEKLRHFPFEAARQANQPPCVLRQKSLADPGLVVKAV